MSSNKPFACDNCARIFTRNENLERHRRSKHQGDANRPFECPRCQTRFSRKDVCKRHAERCRGPRSGHVGSALRSPQGMPADTAPSLNQPPTSDQISLLQHSFPSADSSSSEEAWRQSSVVTLLMPMGELQRSAKLHLAAYWEYFHPSLPLMHRATLNAYSPPLLLNVAVSIGCLYTARNLTGQEAVSCLEMSKSLWEAGHDEIQRLSKHAWRGLSRPWVMQAWLLHVVYGAYLGDTVPYQKAKTLLRVLVDCIQDLGIQKQGIAYPEPRTWVQACAAGAEDPELQGHWEKYIEEESMKLGMQTLMLLDFHILHPCNIRAQTSAVDFDWELPFSSVLWEASTLEDWYRRLLGDARVHSHWERDEVLCLPCPSTTSITMAVQTLMTDSPSLHLLSAMEASPISIVFLLTTIDALVRDLTRSYYQLPPNLADPSAFHILSQTQNRQIAAVLRHVSSLVEEQTEDVRGGMHRPLWTCIERLCVAIKIALYKPDDLMLRGVVDSSVTAGLATATHLTLGQYTGSRRSLQSILRFHSGDDAVLLLLDEVVGSFDSMLCATEEETAHEAPWVTVANYRILLAIWRSVRWAAAEMRDRGQCSSARAPRFDTPAVIFSSIMDAIRKNEIGFGGQVEDDASAPSPLLADETLFSRAILRFWTDRSVWALGSSMAPIMEEIISAGY